MLKHTQLRPDLYRVTMESGVPIGDLVMEVDGYFYFYPTTQGAVWSEYYLTELARILHEVNAEWDEKVWAGLRKKD
jgi:hypothetical protein